MKLKPGYRNSRRVLNVVATGLFLASAILLGFANPVVAAEPPPDYVQDFPAGWACDFDLRIEGWGEEPEVYKEFVDKNGTVVRTLSAGTGFDLLYTNLGTGATFSTKSNGFVQQTTINPDGVSKLTLLGHTIVILFPTDVPAGPSTTLYIGRVVITVDPNGVWTLQTTNAKATDICGALSQ